MTSIQLAIEGAGAEEAAAELAAVPTLDATWQPVEQPTKELLTTLSVIAAIVGIAGGTLAVAEQVRAWYEKWTAGQGKRLDKVLVVMPDGRRFLLKNLTTKQVADLLAELH